MKLNPHGNIDITVDNGVVINKPNEPFNKEGIDALFKAIFSKVKEHNLWSWVLVELFQEDAYPTPSAIDSLINKYWMAKQLGCCVIYTYCSKSCQYHVVEDAAKKAGINLIRTDHADQATELARKAVEIGFDTYLSHP